MDFPNRNVQHPAAPSAASTGGPSSSRKNKLDNSKWGRIGVVGAVVAIVLLLIGLIVAVSADTVNENKYVNDKKLQAVFLNTGQVYFGNIKTMNSKYVVLTNIYYLQTANGSNASSANNNTNVSLVKLGCELHEPYDQMIINREQVTFWENLQDNGQVATAVATFQKQNPQGQKCADQSSAASTNSSSAAQNAGSSSNNNTSTTTNNRSTNP